MEEIVAYIEGLLLEAENLLLTEPQKAVIRAGWENLGYDKLAEYCPYNAGYLRCVASPLWQKLSSVLGEEISKRTFRSQLERIYRNQVKETGIETALVQNIYGQPPVTYKFYGRHEVIKLINGSLENTKCINIYGAKGIGKTSLAAKLFNDCKSKNIFNSLIWHHVNSRFVSEDIEDLLYSIYGENFENPERKFYKELQIDRKLIVFDGVECWSDTGEINTFLKKIVEINHKSLIILTSKLALNILKELELNKRAVVNLLLQGLDSPDIKRIMLNYGLQSKDEDKFLCSFGGNPYLIHRACERVKDVYEGNVEDFVSRTSYAKIQFKGEFDELLNSPKTDDIQKFILNYLSSIEESLPIQFKVLVKNLEQESSFSSAVIENALEVLRGISLIEFLNVNNETLVSVHSYFLKYLKTSSSVLKNYKKVS